MLTAPAAVAAVTDLARDLGKDPIAVGDRPGFVADGLLFGYLNQAAAMYESKYATREDIDAAMRLGCGLPMGPLALLDLIGVDTARTVLEAMYAESRDRLHAPAPILRPARRGRADRPQGGPRLLHATTSPGQRRRSCRTRRPRAAADEPPAGRSGRAASASPAPGRWPAASPRSSRRRASRSCWPPAAWRRRRRPRPGSPSRWAARWTRAGSSAEARDAALAAITPAGSLDAFADVDLAVEAVAEDLAVKQAAVRRRWTRSASRAPSWPPPPPRCRSWPAPAPPRGRRTSSGCTSSTRRRP